MGTQMAATRERKSWAVEEEAPGKGFMKVMRSFGWGSVFGAWAWGLMRWIPRGMFDHFSGAFREGQCQVLRGRQIVLVRLVEILCGRKRKPLAENACSWVSKVTLNVQ